MKEEHINRDHSLQAAAVFNKNAFTYQGKFMDVSLYKEALDIFCAHIPKQNAAILELACGPGNITRYLLNKRPDFKILGTDLAPDMLDLAAVNNPEAEFRLMDCRDLSSTEGQYDAIMCGFGLPYLSEEEAIKLIQDSALHLNSGGVLYLSTMEEDEQNKSGIRRSSSGDELYQYYHQAAYLTDALRESGFTILSLQRIGYPANDDTTVTDLVIVARR